MARIMSAAYCRALDVDRSGSLAAIQKLRSRFGYRVTFCFRELLQNLPAVGLCPKIIHLSKKCTTLCIPERVQE